MSDTSCPLNHGSPSRSMTRNSNPLNSNFFISPPSLFQFNYLSYPHRARSPHRAPVAVLPWLRFPVLRLNALAHRVEDAYGRLSAYRGEAVGFRGLTAFRPPVVPGRRLTAVLALSGNRVALE